MNEQAPKMPDIYQDKKEPKPTRLSTQLGGLATRVLDFATPRAAALRETLNAFNDALENDPPLAISEGAKRQLLEDSKSEAPTEQN